MMFLKTILSRFCKNSNIIVKPADMEGCHRLSLGRNSTTDNKCVIVKFVNMKHSEIMLRSKKSITSKSKLYIVIHNVFITVIFGENAKICKEKAK